MKKLIAKFIIFLGIVALIIFQISIFVGVLGMLNTEPQFSCQIFLALEFLCCVIWAVDTLYK